MTNNYVIVYLERAPRYQPFSRYPLARECLSPLPMADTLPQRYRTEYLGTPLSTFFPALESFLNRLLLQNQLPSGFACEPISTRKMRPPRLVPIIYPE